MNISSGNKIPFGLKNGVMVEVSEVERGLRCGAVCPSCMRPLQARKGDRRAKHFSHDPSTDAGACKYGLETSIHRMAKQILSEEGFLITPELVIKKSKSDNDGVEHEESVLVEKEEIRHFKKVELEKWIDPIRPDIVAYTDDCALLIEVAVTSFSDSKKKSIIRSQGFYAIEIDLSSARDSITKDELRVMLIADKTKRKWLSNPKFEIAKNELITKLDEKVRRVNDSINKV